MVKLTKKKIEKNKKRLFVASLWAGGSCKRGEYQISY